jgi:mannosyl-oligosaccharide glucosidase
MLKLRSAWALLLAASAAVADQQVLSETGKLSNDSLLWGPYRPNLYFGVRPRIPKSLLAGLLWAKVDTFQSAQTGK